MVQMQVPGSISGHHRLPLSRETQWLLPKKGSLPRRYLYPTVQCAPLRNLFRAGQNLPFSTYLCLPASFSAKCTM